jgi:hypothetical protein
MTSLTIIELLYIMLIIFGSIIWTLLILILIKVLKILGPVMELVNFYDKMKKVLQAYANIPDMIKEKASEILNKKKDS